MLTIEVDEQCMERIVELELEIKNWKSNISENTPIMNGYYENMIRYNNELIDRYSTNGIRIEKEA